eukprot:3461738-Pleurochrysis_carterae.AAC.1
MAELQLANKQLQLQAAQAKQAARQAAGRARTRSRVPQEGKGRRLVEALRKASTKIKKVFTKQAKDAAKQQGQAAKE